MEVFLEVEVEDCGLEGFLPLEKYLWAPLFLSPLWKERLMDRSWQESWRDRCGNVEVEEGATHDEVFMVRFW